MFINTSNIFLSCYQYVFRINMELRQLYYFVAVAEELHFGRAARRLNISQPPLSMQIRKLEDELNVRLFKRTSRCVELTEAGQFFLNEVRRILDNIDSAINIAKEAARGSIGKLSVGFVGPAIDTFLPDIIQTFRLQNPGIVLTLSESGTNEQIEALKVGRIQVGFARIYQHVLKDICSEVIWQEPYVLALPESHPFAAGGEIALSELKGQPMIMYPRIMQPSLYDSILRCCEVAGFKPKVLQEARTKHTTIALVAAGLGAAIVPESSRMLRSEGVIYLPIKDYLPVVEISMIWKAGDDSQVLLKFLDTVKDNNRDQTER
jgi:DNA-binding transcriptional LysR family regulator